ncbi:MAG: restriction endonuclease subunit S [Acidobacteriota bacterium]|nr:restriction endonuclease subunit S [Acidobacteriota bacterium]
MATVDDLFEVRYGHSLELNRLKRANSDGGIAFVSRKMGDNGVSAFVEAQDDLPPASPGELSVALGGNGVLSTFLQERPFYTGRDVAVLSPREQMSKASLLYYCMCIKANRYRYSYGRQANRTLRHIVVPSLEYLPKWVDTTTVDRFAGADQPSAMPPLALAGTNYWPKCRLGDLFDIKKGKRLTKARMTPGGTPFIGAIDNSNGLAAYIGQPAIHEANTITVNYNGNGVAEAFYQTMPFWCSDDVNVLYPKFPLTPAIALFIATVIRLERYRFNYGRKWHLNRMRSAVIRLPAKSDGTPDWEYIERYIGSLPFSSQIGSN